MHCVVCTVTVQVPVLMPIQKMVAHDPETAWWMLFAAGKLDPHNTALHIKWLEWLLVSTDDTTINSS